MSQTENIDYAELRRQVEAFIAGSAWADDVPTIPDGHVGSWGTLGWARLVLAMLDAGAQT